MFPQPIGPPLENPGFPAGPQFPARRRRGTIACTVCRYRKSRASIFSCITSETPPVSPCEYCRRKRLKCEYVSITEQEERSENTIAEDNTAQSGMHTAPMYAMPPPAGFSASHVPPQGHSVPNPGQPPSYNTHASYAGVNSAHYSNTAYGAPAPQSMHAAQYPNYASPQPNHPSSAASGRHGYDTQTVHAVQYSSSHGRPSGHPSQSGSQPGIGQYSPNYNPDVTNADYEWASNQNSHYGNRSSHHG
ncbi:hypothetical protein B0H16DRAFT_1455338 [Mycena metata]|uniref:Zn(2)-C6 fungal-type domain-containing protein n=1 Tax=Mycena metata TaxID=1033252 RepID=A0AAD7NIS2_9AGAR|nr:hypothetical protein B0H16DRAFT_1455338 [Mycena metata]